MVNNRTGSGMIGNCVDASRIPPPLCEPQHYRFFVFLSTKASISAEPPQEQPYRWVLINTISARCC